MWEGESSINEEEEEEHSNTNKHRHRGHSIVSCRLLFITGGHCVLLCAWPPTLMHTHTRTLCFTFHSFSAVKHLSYYPLIAYQRYHLFETTQFALPIVNLLITARNCHLSKVINASHLLSDNQLLETVLQPLHSSLLCTCLWTLDCWLNNLLLLISYCHCYRNNFSRTCLQYCHVSFFNVAVICKASHILLNSSKFANTHHLQFHQTKGIVT